MNEPICEKRSWIIKVQKLVITKKTKEWCALPYPGHKGKKPGCPNYYGRCWNCGRSKIRLLTKDIDTKRPIWIVYNEFNLKRHMTKMKRRHPDWSERQLRNVLYWQPRSFKGLDERIKIALDLIKPRPNIVSSGEGQGVNLYATCFHSGLKLEPIRTLKTCRHLAILGYRKTKRKKKPLRKIKRRANTYSS